MDRLTVDARESPLVDCDFRQSDDVRGFAVHSHLSSRERWSWDGLRIFPKAYPEPRQQTTHTRARVLPIHTRRPPQLLVARRPARMEELALRGRLVGLLSRAFPSSRLECNLAQLLIHTTQIALRGICLRLAGRHGILV